LTNYRGARYEARMMWILIIVASLVSLVAVMAGIGLLLPRDHVAARRAVLAKPADDVWRAIVDLGAHLGAPVEVQSAPPSVRARGAA
jgi:hypothetical protein